MTKQASTRLNVTFTRETVLALRSHLAARGRSKGDLSKFIEEAVRWRMLDSTVQAVKARNADVPVEEIYAVIDEACCEVRQQSVRRGFNAD